MIKRNQLIERKEITLKAGHTITAAAICDGLLGIFDMALRTSHAVVEEIGTLGDRLYSAGYLAAADFAPVLDRVVDWDNYGMVQDFGVFPYDHCEVDRSKGFEEAVANGGLPAAIFNGIEAAAWNDMAENWRGVAPADAEQLIREWAAEVGVPLK